MHSSENCWNWNPLTALNSPRLGDQNGRWRWLEHVESEDAAHYDKCLCHWSLMELETKATSVDWLDGDKEDVTIVRCTI